MRTYKFRGKTNSGKWVFGSLVYTDGQQPRIHFPIFFKDDPKKLLKWDWVYVDEKTVGQFTGLLDKNGNEIYEGDIVKRNDDRYFTVVFNHFGFLYFDSSCNNGAVYYPFGFMDGEEVEIFGNIHEKKEITS